MGKLLEQRNRALDDINAGRTVKKIRDLESRVRELEEENARLRADNIAFARNLKGKSATTGATYEHICTQLAASQLHAEQLREALNQWINIAANCSIQSGCCCCGDSMENHASPIACGHSPVDMADSVVPSAIQKTYNALALPRDTNALDAYVAEKVKEAMK